MQVPSQMSVDAGWPCLWVLAFCAGCWHAVQQRNLNFLGVPAANFLFAGTVPANKESAAGTVPANKGGVANQTFVFFSIVRHASTQHRTPAPRGMASQHLGTFERVPVNKKLLTGTESRSITSFILVSALILILSLCLKTFHVEFNFKSNTNLLKHSCLHNYYLNQQFSIVHIRSSSLQGILLLFTLKY